MEHYGLPKCILNYTPLGVRNVVRSSKGWKDIWARRGLKLKLMVMKDNNAPTQDAASRKPAQNITGSV
jgi:hypothetical protein